MTCSSRVTHEAVSGTELEIQVKLYSFLETELFKLSKSGQVTAVPLCSSLIISEGKKSLTKKILCNFQMLQFGGQ